jgi:uncharacterized membrane protein YjjP (DUF1212 family)
MDIAKDPKPVVTPSSVQESQPVEPKMTVTPESSHHLERAVLADIVDLALRAGELLMYNGAESQRVEETVRILGTGLGCDWGDVLVSYNAIIVTHASGDEFRTKIRRVSPGGVNMSMLEAISHLAHRVEEGKYDRHRVRTDLERISAAPRRYNRWVTAVVVGLACAAFCRLFGGDWLAMAVTWAAATVAMIVRQELARRHFNQLMVAIVTAFVAGGLVGLVDWFHLSPHLEPALAASVLLLVPGVPFINAVEDLIKGHLAVGVARATAAVLIVLGIALGLLAAMWLTAVSL